MFCRCWYCGAALGAECFVSIISEALEVSLQDWDVPRHTRRVQSNRLIIELPILVMILIFLCNVKSTIKTVPFNIKSCLENLTNLIYSYINVLG